MTDYSKMSDFEINLRVAEIVIDYDCISRLPHTDMAVHWGDGANWHTFNPCNNPADAWPIIVDNGISLDCIVVNRHEKTWRAQFNPAYVKHHMNDKNLRRAAMIVFLMMQEKK